MLLIPARVRYLIDKGRKEANAEWEAWFKRYKEAQAKGLEFTEPPPSSERNGKSA